ncbi:VpaChn25_0724 family phage protein [Methylorubrum extorquens]|uniref:VpaChn25_0724 family phage protein n=1 Tax=Methylorubrum extorquens TaxID=408 RepID=UPI003F61AC77
MSAKSFTKFAEEDARLVVLRELYQQTNGRLNDGVLTEVLSAFGHDRSREWVRTQLHKMQDLGAIQVTEAGSSLIVAITKAGVDHVLRRGRIEGIKQPALGV